MFLDEGIDIPPKSPIDLRSSSFAPRHSLQAHSALGLASVEKGGLGPASQEKSCYKERYLVVLTF